MKILGLGNENICILTKAEMVKRSKGLGTSEALSRLNDEPLPYPLFRLNEIMGYKLNLVGCEITEDQYMDRLEQLPPIPFKYDIYLGYIVPECITGNTYEHIFNHNGKYYCVIMEAKRKALALSKGWF